MDNIHNHRRIAVWRNHHLWYITAIIMACSIFYYLDTIIEFMGWPNPRWGIFYGPHDLQRLLFFIPVLYAAYIFRVRGVIVTASISMLIFLPRAIFISTYSDALFRPMVFFIVIGAMGILLAWLLDNITGRKKGEEKLLESEERYRLISQNTSDLIATTTFNLKAAFTYVSPSYETVLGYEPKDLVGKRSFDFIHPDDKKQLLPLLKKYVVEKAKGLLIGKELKASTVIEYRIKDKSGNWHYFESTANFMADELLFFSRDITERKRMEEELLFKTTLLETQKEASIDSILVIDSKSQVISYNKRFVEMWNVPKEVLATKDDAELLVNASSQLKEPDEFINKVKYLYAHEKEVSSDEIELKDGRVFDRYSAPLETSTGEYLGRIWFCRDITERKQAQEELRESERRYRLLAENAKDVIWTVDMNMRPTYMSPSITRLLGYSVEEAMALPMEAVYAPASFETAMKVFAEELAIENMEQKGLSRSRTLDLELIRKDGSIIPVEIKFSFMREPDGRPIAILAIARDTTERKQMEKKLAGKRREAEAASQAKSEFLASMSHELRTPLNAVIGFSELMLDGVPGKINDEQRQCLSDILSSGQHLLNLINDVLDLSKVEARRMELRLENLNLADVIDDVVQTVKPMLDENRHKMRMSIVEELPQVRADRSKLRQILLNLLSNAIKFTPPGGKLAIEVSREGDWCQVNVVDNGIGIKKEDRERIFEAFIQADTLLDRKKEGTGLGLALTKQFVELMGGRIWVESEYGKGSKFTFALPLAREGKPHVEELEEGLLEAEEPLLIPGQKQILVVDDDRKARSLLRAWLKAEGYAVAEASTGDEGIKQAKELLPAAIILDILMPGKDGWQVLQELKSMPETRDIPVVIASIVGEKELGFSLGAVDYFVKPVEKKGFMKRIAELSLARGEKVLVVDDNPEDVRLVASILEAEGIGVLRAYGGGEGVRMAKENKPALIVLDILMPDLSGFEVIKRLRGDVKTRNIPIIILTIKELTEEEFKMLSRQTKAIMIKTTFRRGDFLSEVKRAANLGNE